MTGEEHTGAGRFEAAFALFQATCDLDPEERAKALDRECADPELRKEVDALFSVEEVARARFETPAVSLHDSPIQDHPEFIADFRILGVLGTGGMGVVYEAEQRQPRRLVALKLIRTALTTPELERRFDREAEILARLNHPGIAQIHAAGTLETEHGSQPYFAMELVRGERLTKYADENDLSTGQRLELMARVADAVQHAHENGIIHRDLKPGNILVDANGQPKILDFGVALMTESDVDVTTRVTSVGEVVGTLAYMSPEQIRSDRTGIDTRSDVYALGIVAYELLAGRPPYQVGRAIHQAASIILEEDPRDLGTVDRTLKGDVETIVGKALEKEKTRRYASAEDFASDIRRHLANEPIAARPQSRVYRLRKFTRRNRTLVLGVSGVFLTLIVGVITSTTFYLRSEDQRKLVMEEAERAKTEASTANQVTAFLEEMFGYANPELSGGDQITARTILERAAERVRVDLQEQPVVRARLLNSIGKIQMRLLMYADAVPILEEALELRSRQFGADSLEAAEVMERLGRALSQLSELERAEDLQRAVLQIREQRLGRSHELGEAMNNLALTLSMTDRQGEAEKLLRETIQLRRDLGLSEEFTLIAIANLGELCSQAGRYEEADELLRQALASAERIHGWNHPSTTAAIGLLGSSLRRQERFEEAEILLSRSLGGSQNLYGEKSERAYEIRGQIALAKLEDGRIEEAVEEFTNLLEELDQAGMTGGRLHVDTLANLGAAVYERPDFEEAEYLYIEAIELARAEGIENRTVLDTYHNLALLYTETGRLEEAEALERETWELRAAKYGPTAPYLYSSIYNLSKTLDALGREDEAKGILLDALNRFREAHGAEHYIVVRLQWNHAERLADLGRYEEAEQELLTAWSNYPKSATALPTVGRGILASLAALYRDWGRPEDSAHWEAELEAFGS